MRSFTFSLAAAVLLSGCASQPIQQVPLTATRARVFRRNYSLNERRTAFAGEPVVTVKDYVELHRNGRHMRPSSGFRVKQALSPWFAVAPDTSLPVVGSLTLEGQTYTLVSVRDDAEFSTAVLVSPDGKPYRKLIDRRTGILIVGTATFEPPTVAFGGADEDVVVDTTAGFVNFELLYGGTDGRAFTLTYREYTPQDLLKAGFTQTLTYENGAEQVRFRGVQLQIFRVTSSALEYAVLADGLAAP